MCNNDMNLPLFILVKSPYFAGRDDLSFFCLLTLFYFFCFFYKCFFNGSDLIFLSSIFFLCFLDSSSMIFFVFSYGE
jgi:hypothetical protein